MRLVVEDGLLVGYGFREQRVELPEATTLLRFRYTHVAARSSREVQGLAVLDGDGRVLLAAYTPWADEDVREFAAAHDLTVLDQRYFQEPEATALLEDRRAPSYVRLHVIAPGDVPGLIVMSAGMLGGIAGGVVLLRAVLPGRGPVAVFFGIVWGLAAGAAVGAALWELPHIAARRLTDRRRPGACYLNRVAGIAAVEGGITVYGGGDQLIVVSGGTLLRYRCVTENGPVEGLAVLDAEGRMAADIEAPSGEVEEYARRHGLRLRDETPSYPDLLRMRVWAEIIRLKGDAPDKLTLWSLCLALVVVVGAPFFALSLVLPHWFGFVDLVGYPATIGFAATRLGRTTDRRRKEMAERRDAARVGPDWPDLKIELTGLADGREARDERRRGN